MNSASQNGNVSVQIQHEIEQFLFNEAELIDDHKFRQWLDCFSEGVRYWMPIRTNRPPRERNLEISSENELATYDERKSDLELRVAKIETGKAWAEEPPSRTRHLLGNIRVKQSGERFKVSLNFILVQCRNDLDYHQFVGERFDILSRNPASPLGFVIDERKIVLDQVTLPAPSISFFF